MNTEQTTVSPNSVDLSVIIPLYNEEDSIRELYHEICRACDPLNRSFEMIFIDDGSTDGSFAVLEALHRSDPRVKVIQFRRNMGKSDALAAGFRACRGTDVATLDADLQDDPAEIPGLLEALEDVDLVSGWKKKRRDPWSKRVLSIIYNRVTAWMTKIKIHDINCGLKVYRREVVETLSLYGELHRYIPVLAQWEGFRIGERTVHHRPRKYGRTKYGLSRLFKGFLDLITVIFISRYTRRPLHLFGLVGFLTTLAGLGITLYLVILRILEKSYLTNRPLLFIGVLLLIVGIQFVSIGLLGEMITRSQASRHTYSIRRSLGV